MKKAFVVAVFALCAVPVAGWSAPSPETDAHCPAPVTVPSPTELPHMLAISKDRGFLWKITKNGHSSWLYGTLHVGRRDWLLPGPTVRTTLLQSDTVALELNMNDPETVRTLQRQEDPARMRHLIETGRKAKLDRFAALDCIPAERFAHMAVGLEAAGLTAVSARSDGYYPDYAVDAILTGMARGMKKPLVALENASSQWALLVGDSQADEDADIDDTLHGLETGRIRKDLLVIAGLWDSSNLEKLDHYRQWCDCLNTPAERRQMTAMLDGRNGPMAQKIASLHESGHTLFVGVGSLHMIGEKGLPALLRQQGFAVEQVLPKPA
ncbi:TraB/GumN family protein [Gluconobacter morbifer]|uniref:GumN family protein n=1 Tax=Gluconobacter morbifer G707 TaxID=1088869 RepID=G6XME5_9PROT|nr:TraB/GumN family protein [Gluconobacter morbifer]EHH67043.1 hypothetical protein GMO_26630 [Gluconobacter morbifer G707]